MERLKMKLMNRKDNIQTSILLREEYWNLCMITSGVAT